MVESGGSKDNIIILDGLKTRSFSPFRDDNPEAEPGAAYKAVAFEKMRGGLHSYKLADGIHWSLMVNEPVITDGAFDSTMWKGGSDISALAGRPVRLRILLRDADLYSTQFRYPASRRIEGARDASPPAPTPIRR